MAFRSDEVPIRMKKDRSCNMLIRDIYNEWTRCSGRFQSAYGISQAQLAYMKCLYEAGSQGLYLKELEQRLQIGQASVVRMIDRLVSMGIVKKIQDKRDSRKKKACLTSIGKERYDKAIESWESVEDEFTQNLNEEELKTLEQLLARVYENSMAASERFR